MKHADEIRNMYAEAVAAHAQEVADEVARFCDEVIEPALIEAAKARLQIARIEVPKYLRQVVNYLRDNGYKAKEVEATCYVASAVIITIK